MDLVVRVRAAGDSSLTSVFRPLLAASAAASRGVEAQLASSGKGAARAAAEGAAAHKAAASAQASSIKAIQALRNADHREFLANLKTEEAEAKKTAKAIGDEQRKQAKASAAEQRKALEMASGAARTFGSLARTGLSTLGSAAMGFGVDFSLQSGLAKSVARDTLARNISAQAYRGRPGEVAEDPEALQALAQKVGEKYKIDPGKALGGLGKFQALTGDLETGKVALDGLAKLAKGFGVDLDQMVGAAGQVSSALGDVGPGKAFATNAEKAAELNRIMRATTAQTQEGAIEMADFVTQFAKLKGAGIRFEGNVGDNITKMSAMAQMAYQTGGAGSVSQASNSVMAFVNTLSTAARRSAFKKYGVDIDSKEAGKFLDPYEIMKQSLAKTGGDTDKMKDMWKNVLGEKAVNALSGAYRGAGGGKAGLAAVDALTAKFGGTITDAQLEKNLSTQMGSKASDAQAFQNELDKITSAMGTELAPALKELAPVALSAAKGLAAIVNFGAQNPGLAITGAIVASIGKAALGETIGKAVGGMLGSLTPATAGLGLLAAAAAYAAYAITDWQAKSDAEKGKGDKDAALVAKAQKELKDTGKISKDTIDEIAMRRAEVAGMQGALKTGGVDYQGATAVVVSHATGGADQIAAGEGATEDAKRKGKEGVDALAAKLDSLIAAYKEGQKKPTGPIDVNIIGGLPAPGPAVNNAARSSGVQ